MKCKEEADRETEINRRGGKKKDGDEDDGAWVYSRAKRRVFCTNSFSLCARP